jgi:hypothetical protein
LNNTGGLTCPKIKYFMSKSAAGEISYYLNRLMFAERRSPGKIKPLKTIQNLYRFYDLTGVKKMFRKFCEAAIAEEYSWNEGTPGNLLYFYEQLEGLIEACYLIYIKKKINKRQAKKDQSFFLPVINEFFEQHSLPEWKQSIHLWLEAALSNFSVAESIDVKEILPYYQNIEQLLEAAYLLTLKT